MTKQELQLELLKLQEQGLRVLQMCQAGMPFNQNPQYSQWMTSVSLFAQRHLQDHPLFKDIESAYFFRNDRQQGFVAMLGLLDTISKDNEYWKQTNALQSGQSSSAFAIQANNMLSPSLGKEERLADQAPESKKMPGHRNTVFISHRSIDKAVADMLFSFLIKTGVPRESIFCSSLPGNDVKQLISSEVKQAIRTSLVNIAILSEDYYESAYCVNEAGILWYLDSVCVIPITLPEITSDKMIGFLNKEYKPRHLDNSDDIAYIYDTITEKLNISQQKSSVINTESKKLIAEYTDYVAKRESSQHLKSEPTKSQPALGITIVKNAVTNTPEKNPQTYEFEVILSNQSDRTLSVFEKYLHFYKKDQEIKREEVTRFEVHRRKDALDDLFVLEPVNGIITLAPGHAERAGIIRDYNDVREADKITFSCLADQEKYEVMVFSKE